VTVDPRAATGFAASAAAYDSARPAYPAAAVSRLARELGLRPDGVVLDLAAGTGKLTRELLPLAARVVAVEPSAAMRAALQANLPGVDALDGSAEAIPLPDATVHAVFVGQAFHWFAVPQASREIARVLTPGGGLALLWNRADWSARDHPWLPALDALLTPYRHAAGPFPAEDTWPQALAETALFTPLRRAETTHEHRIHAEQLVELVASWSWIANLPEGQRAAVLGRVRDLVGDRRRLALRYRTELFWTRRA
jgi:SAM-dependent methyltransferase